MSASRIRRPPATADGHRRELLKLRASLAYTEELLRGIRTGEVETMVVAGSNGLRVFTLEGAEQDYRVLIESMTEGALTLSSDMVILFANKSFARMVGHPLEEVMGTLFSDYFAQADWASLRPCLRAVHTKRDEFRLSLKSHDGSLLPAQVSICPLPHDRSAMTTISVVVTDMTESRRSENQLKDLTRRVVAVQEAERERIVRELHDNVTQHLCAILVRVQAFVQRQSQRAGTVDAEAVVIRDLLGQTAEETERISRNLRPSVLKELGLVEVMRDTGADFAQRTGVVFRLSCAKLSARLPADTELVLYRILQESLGNIEKHARSRLVAVVLRVRRAAVQMVITDDGIGFAMDQTRSQRISAGRIGLLGMRERATYVGGVLTISSKPGIGTEIDVRIPLSGDIEDARREPARRHRSPDGSAQKQPKTATS